MLIELQPDPEVQARLERERKARAKDVRATLRFLIGIRSVMLALLIGWAVLGSTGARPRLPGRTLLAITGTAVLVGAGLVRDLLKFKKLIRRAP